MTNQRPYESFGRQIKKLRAQTKRSLIDVSGAVEIKPEDLNRIESGELQPSEELVVLFVNHFDLSEDDASQLWQLAGYFNQRDQGMPQQPVQLLSQ